MHVDDIHWANWEPQQRASLLFIIRDEKILLIHKKRGLGAGNINGPGGRLEPGETPLQAAIRETEEEVGVTPENVTPCGQLHFQFLDGLSIHVYVYKASDYSGTLIETDEAIPFWNSVHTIPYDRMWEDDEYWFPMLLSGIRFQGYFVFDQSKMLNYRLDSIDR